MDHNQFLFGLGSFTPRTLSILAIWSPLGIPFPFSHELMSDFGMHKRWANCS